MNTLQSGRSFLTSIDSLAATPQQTFEQYSLPIWRSREPTHWMKQRRFGGSPFDGPHDLAALSIFSRSISVMTSSCS
jgi:hypothetical protein